MVPSLNPGASARVPRRSHAPEGRKDGRFCVLVAPNAFKGSLTALEAARAMSLGVRDAYPRSRTLLLPISDGGDGLIDCLLHGLGGRRVRVAVKGPLGARRKAAFGLLPDGAAVVEMAQASGLALVPKERRDALGATSYGTGQLIAAAVERGARRVIVGLGGSATNDGGAGMAQALGARLLDKDGRDLPLGAEALLDLARIEWGGLKKTMKGVKVLAVSDVTNPLLGAAGSARVFGPQKGAGPAQVRILEAALAVYARRLREDLGRDVAGLPGTGAAGGLGAGLLAFLSARLAPGADWVLKELGARALLRRADAVLTGEGRLDATSLYGKAPVALARLAKARGLPAAAVCGLVDKAALGSLNRAGIQKVVAFSRVGASSKDSMTRAGHWARQAAKVAAGGLLSLFLCPALTSRAAAAPYEEVDALYFHRDQPGNLEAAIERLEALLKARPEAAPLHWRLARGLVRLGERREKKKAKLALFERAEAESRRAVELDPKDKEAHFWLGIAMGRRAQARGILKSLFVVGPLKREMAAVLKLDPDHGGAHHVLGEMYFQVPGFAGGDKKKAVAELEAAERCDPEYTAHYAPLSEAYRAVGQRDKAVAALKRGLAVTRPADPAEAESDRGKMRQLLEKLGEKP